MNESVHRMLINDSFKLEERNLGRVLTLREFLDRFFAHQKELTDIKKKGYSSSTQKYKGVQSRIIASIDYVKENYVNSKKWPPYAINYFNELELLLVNWKSIFISYNLDCELGKNIPKFIQNNFANRTNIDGAELLKLKAIGEITKKYLQNKHQVYCSEYRRSYAEFDSILKSPWLFLQLVDEFTLTKKKENNQYEEFSLFNDLITKRHSILKTRYLPWQIQEFDKNIVPENFRLWNEYTEKFKLKTSHKDLWSSFLSFIERIESTIEESEKAINSIRPKICICIFEPLEGTLEKTIYEDIEFIKNNFKYFEKHFKRAFIKIEEFLLPGENLTCSLERLFQYEICYFIIPVTNQVLLSEDLEKLINYKDSLMNPGKVYFGPVKIRPIPKSGYSYLDEKKVKYLLKGESFNRYEGDRDLALTDLIQEMWKTLDKIL